MPLGRRGIVAIAALSWLPLFGGGVVTAQDAPELARGIREVKDGSFEAALLTLDAAVQKLRPTDRRSDLAQAHVYLGVAYLGLGQEALAKLKFRQALEHRPDLRLSADEFSPRVIRVFEAAREAAERTATLEKESKKSRGKGGLILLGVGGAAAAAVGVAIVRERENTPPTASVAVSPDGQAILNVTRLTFTASGRDAENDPLRYTWAFGDGETGSGATTTHVYARTGDQHVVLSVNDGLATTTATTTVVVGTLGGVWRPTTPVLLGVTQYEIEPRGTGFGLTALFPGAVPGACGSGLLEHPRAVSMGYRDPYGPLSSCGGPCSFRFDGTADRSLSTLSGTLACSGGGGACSCEGQQQPLTLVR